jgi:hypothetical protein
MLKAFIQNERLKMTVIWNLRLQMLRLVIMLQSLLMNWKMAIPFIFFYVIGLYIGAKRHLKMNGEIFGMRGI